MRQYLYRFATMAAAMLMVLLGSLPAAPAHAQNSSLAYGADMMATLSAEIPISAYNFYGSAGDLIKLRVTALPGEAGTLNPSLTLASESGAFLLGNNNTVLNEDKTDAQLSAILPETGSYSLIVGGTAASLGDYALQLYGRAPVEGEELVLDAPVRVLVPLGQQLPQVFHFNASETCDTTLTITVDSPGSPYSFRYASRLYDPQGATMGQMRGGRALENRYTVPAGSGRYEVEVFSDDALSEGALILTTTCANAQPVCGQFVAAPPVFPTPTPTPTPPSGQMVLMQMGGNLTYGAALSGSLANVNSIVGYTFSGVQGDLITLAALAGDSQVDPSLTLLDTTNLILTASDNDVFSPNGVDASISLYLPQTGMYTALVGAENELGGAFHIKLLGREAAGFIATPLATGVVTPVNFTPEVDPDAVPTSQYFTFDALTCPTTLTVDSATLFPFALKVRDETGAVVAQIEGGKLIESRLTVAPESGRYEVEVLSTRPDLIGQISLLISCGDDAPLCPDFTRQPHNTPRPRNTPTQTRTLPPCPAFFPTVATTPGSPFGDLPLASGPRLQAMTLSAHLTGTPPAPCATLTPTPTRTRPPITRTFTPPPPPPNFCGDGICNGDGCDCSVDCGNDPNWNAVCNPPPSTFCGDGVCNGDDCNCTVDCANDANWNATCFPPPPAGFCGDGICSPELGENTRTVQGDPSTCQCMADCSTNESCITPG